MVERNMAHLTEPGVRQYFVHSLQACKEHKMHYYTKVVNACLFAAFFLIGGALLYYKYKGKMTVEEKKSKLESDRIYILNKVKEVQSLKQNDSMRLITNLPGPENAHFFH